MLLGGRDVTRVPAHRRGVGLVFQDAALFPAPRRGGQRRLRPAGRRPARGRAPGAGEGSAGAGRSRRDRTARRDDALGRRSAARRARPGARAAPGGAAPRRAARRTRRPAPAAPPDRSAGALRAAPADGRPCDPRRRRGLRARRPRRGPPRRPGRAGRDARRALGEARRRLGRALSRDDERRARRRPGDGHPAGGGAGSARARWRRDGGRPGRCGRAAPRAARRTVPSSRRLRSGSRCRRSATALPSTWTRTASWRCRCGGSRKRGEAEATLAALRRLAYSHSIVAGGLELRSSATRLTPGTSLTMRLEIASSSS